MLAGAGDAVVGVALLCCHEWEVGEHSPCLRGVLQTEGSSLSWSDARQRLESPNDGSWWKGGTGFPNCLSWLRDLHPVLQTWLRATALQLLPRSHAELHSRAGRLRSSAHARFCVQPLRLVCA